MVKVKHDGNDMEMTLAQFRQGIRDGTVPGSAYALSPALFGDELWHRVDQIESPATTAAAGAAPAPQPQAQGAQAPPVASSPPVATHRQPAWPPPRMSAGGYITMMFGGQALALILYFAAQGNVATLVVAGALYLFAGIVALVALYRMWKAIQGPDARTSPGTAVGYMFIPVFNLVWSFIAYIGWAVDYNKNATRLGDREGVSLPKMPTALFAISATVGLLAGVFLFQPTVSAVLEGLDAILTIPVMYSVCLGVNKLAAFREAAARVHLN